MTMLIQSINPATEEVLATFEELGPKEVDRAIENASTAFHSWRTVPIAERSRRVRGLGSYLLEHKAKLAELVTAEMGKPIRQALGEIDKCAIGCEFYAENAERFLAPQEIEIDGASAYVKFDPIGIVLAIMPWNFPFWQVIRFAAPALMAGNVALLKPAPNVPQCALAIAEAFRSVGFPEHVFQTLLIDISPVERIIADSRVQAVTLTGSDRAGSKVAELSGRHIKKTVLELGGSDPFLVLSDADLVSAAKVGARARNQNAGQSCIAAKRFIVLASVADRFVELFVKEVASLKVGDPMDANCDVGPLAREDLLQKLEDQVQRSVQSGARVLLGGRRLNRKGYFYAPSVLTDLARDSALLGEEVFGPVAAIVRVRDISEALQVANATQFGLGATVWTGDASRAREIADQLEAGMVFINGMVASDPRLPFGGVKRSGYGRELSDFGIREFTNIKTVWIAESARE